MKKKTREKDIHCSNLIKRRTGARCQGTVNKKLRAKQRRKAQQ